MDDEIPTIGAGSREYIHWSATGLPAGATAEISLDDGTSWTPTTVNGAIITALIASPTAPALEGQVVAPRTGFIDPQIRIADNPEIVIRPAGTIEIR